MSADSHPIEHRTDTLRTADGTELFLQRWLPETRRASLVLAHGYAEHSGRYDHLIQRLLESGIGVYALDHRGHGRSGGKRGWIGDFDLLPGDLDQLIQRVRAEQTARPLILLGHSMGGLLSLRYVQDHPGEVDLLMLSAPYLVDGGNVTPLLLKCSRAIAALAPWMPIKQLDASAISRDGQVVREYEHDPLNFRGKIRARTGFELLTAGPRVLRGADRIQLPVLIMHGDADRIADVSGSQQLHERVASADKTLRIYAGLYHEILHEPERDTVVADMLAWLEQRI